MGENKRGGAGRVRAVCVSLAAMAILFSATGCTKYYWMDRTKDATDVFTSSVGTGVGLKTRIGPLAFGLAALRDRWGVRGGEFFSISRPDPEFPPCKDVQFSIFGGYEHFSTGHMAGDIRKKHFKARTYFMLQLPMGKTEESEDVFATGLDYYSQVEIALGLHGSWRFGFNAMELLDFLFGWAYLDLSMDDLGRMRANLKIRGRIQDEEGNPMPGISLRSRVFDFQSFDEAPTTRTKTLGFAFDEIFVDCHRVALSFEHPGYQAVRFAFDLTRPERPLRRVEKRFFVFDAPIVMRKTDERLRREKREAKERARAAEEAARPNHPEVYDVWFSWDPRRGGGVWDVSDLRPPEVSQWEAMRLVPDPAKADFPRLYIQPVDSEGRALKTDASAKSDPDAVLGKVATVRLVLDDDQGGGFVPLAFHGGTKRGILAGLQDPPDAGYEPALEIRGELLTREGAFEEKFFYIKVGGRYGKGYLNWAQADTMGMGKALLRVSGRFVIQRDGTKNLQLPNQ